MTPPVIVDERVPTRLHVSMLAPDGSPQWSGQFANYVGGATVDHRVARFARAWWHDAAFVAQMESLFGVVMTQAVITMVAERSLVSSVVPRFNGITEVALERAARRILRLARSPVL